MHEVVGDCPQNPRKTGHCYHSDVHQTTAGMVCDSRCCWCGDTQRSVLSLPEHGRYNIDEKHS